MGCPSPEKTEYRSERRAKHALQTLRDLGKGDEGMHVYPCLGHWHLGHAGAPIGHWNPNRPKRPPAPRPHVTREFIIVGAHQVLIGGVCLTVSHGTEPDRVGASLADHLAARGLPLSLVDHLVLEDHPRAAAALHDATDTEIAAVAAAWIQHRTEDTHQ